MVNSYQKEQGPRGERVMDRCVIYHLHTGPDALVQYEEICKDKRVNQGFATIYCFHFTPNGVTDSIRFAIGIEFRHPYIQQVTPLTAILELFNFLQSHEWETPASGEKVLVDFPKTIIDIQTKYQFVSGSLRIFKYLEFAVKDTK